MSEQQTEVVPKGAGIATKAAMQATKRLREKHPQDYKKFLAEERSRVGLPEDPMAAKLSQQLQKAEERVAQLRERLNTPS